MKNGVYIAVEPRPGRVNRQLAVVDVHCDFEAEAQIVVAWFFPFHIELPQKIGLVKNSFFSGCDAAFSSKVAWH